MNRRNFIGKSALVAAASATFKFQIANARTFGANERVNLAFIGAGGRGAANIRSLIKNPLANLVAFADVDDERASETYKSHSNVPRFKDFRKMMDRLGRDIDAVVVSTPDHTHHYPAKWCLQSSKHVYLEKPLAKSIEECRDLARLEKETGLICQMGNQGHSGQGIELLDKWIAAGILGEIDELVAWNQTGRHPKALTRPPAEPIPNGLDWDLWLGPSPKVPYNSEYCPGSWRWWFDFGNGSIGDWACHNMDAPYYALGLGLPSSVQIQSTGPSKLNFPESTEVIYTFPRKGKKDLIYKWYSGDGFGPERPQGFDPDLRMGSGGGGTLVFGSQASVIMNSHANSPRIFPDSKFKELAPQLPKVDRRSSHHDNWLLACRGDEKPRSHFQYSARLTEVMHYGNIAMHVNRDLDIDPDTGNIIGDPEAARFMRSPLPRKGWEI